MRAVCMYVHDILIKCFDKRWNSFASHCIHHTHHTHHTRTQDTVAKVVVGGTEWCMAMGSVASPRNVGVAPSSRPALLACLLHIVLHAAPLGPPLTLPPYTAFFLLLLVPVTSLLSSLSLSLLLYAALLSLCLPFVRRGAARYLSVPTTTPAQVYIDRTWKRRMQRYPSVLFSFRSANFSQSFLTATGIFRILNFFSSFKDRWY